MKVMTQKRDFYKICRNRTELTHSCSQTVFCAMKCRRSPPQTSETTKRNDLHLTCLLAQIISEHVRHTNSFQLYAQFEV